MTISSTFDLRFGFGPDLGAEARLAPAAAAPSGSRARHFSLADAEPAVPGCARPVGELRVAAEYFPFSPLVPVDWSAAGSGIGAVVDAGDADAEPKDSSGDGPERRLAL
jgi:hypothetical protein